MSFLDNFSFKIWQISILNKYRHYFFASLYPSHPPPSPKKKLVNENWNVDERPTFIAKYKKKTSVSTMFFGLYSKYLIISQAVHVKLRTEKNRKKKIKKKTAKQIIKNVNR